MLVSLVIKGGLQNLPKTHSIKILQFVWLSINAIFVSVIFGTVITAIHNSFEYVDPKLDPEVDTLSALAGSANFSMP